ncbi:hypothetical protein BOO69_00530 [Sulfitobacter alexandrii]|uniref:HTH luxR-type domain-containing protein n=1 Tax=Sulfitobacter alexandrii TaxID=1917485 RepID=A0A1J0WCL4_9RHOB|nr:helix-turn-helix transcriptional regulator [Sulfitobacter alexandrii]APE42063.1 hypothetical protein BOO69_00530 [Sulfitobacter alexandrii]
MNRSDLSDFVIQLTESATRLAPLDFHRNLIRLVRSIARFDAAWWGWSVIRERHLSFVHAQTINLDAGFVDAARAQLATDPFVQSARRLRLFAQTLHHDEVDPGSSAARVLRDFGIAQVLAGHSQVADGPFNFFMSVYRRAPEPRFTREEAADFRILLRHLQQALSLSLRLSLEASASRKEEWALADDAGAVFLQSAGFPALHRQAGLGPIAEVAPGASVVRSGIVLRAERYSDDLRLLRAAPGTDLPQLTTRERQVCRLYIDGLSRREVAAALGLSENTVRNQIAAIYRKTGSRDRIDLLRKMDPQ